MCTTLVLTAAARPQQGDRGKEVRHYEDAAHHDSHEWNDKEDQAWQRYLQEHHKKNHEFAKANKKEQQDYWNWRHGHPDEERH